jgi:hypothetical protein
MGRVEAFSLPGCECWFHTGDHGPHHFHAGVADEWEVRIMFLQEPVDFEVKFQIKRYSPALASTLARARCGASSGAVKRVGSAPC